MSSNFIISFFLLFALPLFVWSYPMIDQLEKIRVNDSEQYVSYRGHDINKPIVLFVHGGPGSPLMLFSRAFDNIFLNDFVVVHWDQRGTGKSYDSTLPISTFSAEQVAKDGLFIVEHLKKKFNRTKILLVGHSWGSIVGALMVKEKPENFLAYISVGTVVDMIRGDSIKYEYLKHEIAKKGNKSNKEDLSKMGPPPWKDFSQLVLQSRLMTQFKGSFYNLDKDQINSAVEKNTEYSPLEMKNLDISMDKIWHKIQPFLSSYNALKSIPELNVPLFFAQGSHDMATPTALVKEYFGQIKAPQGKQWVEFANSAHFPMYEEPAVFVELLKRAVK